MENMALYAEWMRALAIAAVIIVIAAVLLIAIWVAARRILRLAKVALTLVMQIKENTKSIWNLQTTNQIASEILEETATIDQHAGEVAAALEEA